jgi:hypothetical protein
MGHFVVVQLFRVLVQYSQLALAAQRLQRARLRQAVMRRVAATAAR